MEGNKRDRSERVGLNETALLGEIIVAIDWQSDIDLSLREGLYIFLWSVKTVVLTLIPNLSRSVVRSEASEPSISPSAFWAQ